MSLLFRRHILLLSLCNPIRAMSVSTFSTDFRVLQVDGKDVPLHLSRLVPQLKASSRKGDSGRIGVIGGSPDYTGAPYYAGAAALKMGADLAFVFCATEACVPIKSYSPELMVTSFYNGIETIEYDDSSRYTDPMTAAPRTKKAEAESELVSENIINDVVEWKIASRMAERVTRFLPRLDSLVLGPGLGRNKIVLLAVKEIINAAKRSNYPIVLDADALWLVANDFTIVYGYKRCVLTPNVPEFNRLVEAAKRHCAQNILESSASLDQFPSENLKDGKEHSLADMKKILDGLNSSTEEEKIKYLSISMGGVTVLRKGPTDMVSGGQDVFVLKTVGSLKRCGGQGDILAGCVAVAVCWAMKNPSGVTYEDVQRLSQQCSSNKQHINVENENKNIWSALYACELTRRSSCLAFEQCKRSMSSPDVLLRISDAFESMQPSTSTPTSAPTSNSNSI